MEMWSVVVSWSLKNTKDDLKMVHKLLHVHIICILLIGCIVHMLGNCKTYKGES